MASCWVKSTTKCHLRMISGTRTTLCTLLTAFRTLSPIFSSTSRPCTNSMYLSMWKKNIFVTVCLEWACRSSQWLREWTAATRINSEPPSRSIELISVQMLPSRPTSTKSIWSFAPESTLGNRTRASSCKGSSNSSRGPPKRQLNYENE